MENVMSTSKPNKIWIPFRQSESSWEFSLEDRRWKKKDVLAQADENTQKEEAPGSQLQIPDKTDRAKVVAPLNPNAAIFEPAALQSYDTDEHGDTKPNLVDAIDKPTKLPLQLTLVQVPVLRADALPSRGALFHAMSIHGVIYLDVGSSLESRSAHYPSLLPKYARWRGLLSETWNSPEFFHNRPCVQRRHLRMTKTEDLRRTLDGEEKEYAPDDRYTIGISDNAQYRDICWYDLQWLLEDYVEWKSSLTSLIDAELRDLCVTDKNKGNRQLLSSKILSGVEHWSASAVRHCFYPSSGTCTEHTDYGVATMTHCSGPGLEAHINGQWYALNPEDGCLVVFAGDMLERLTNGHIKALLHRVVAHAAPENSPKFGDRRRIARQSHILFLQPDNNTIVQPLSVFSHDTATDNLGPIRYGEWHKKKVELAFNWKNRT